MPRLTKQQEIQGLRTRIREAEDTIRLCSRQADSRNKEIEALKIRTGQAESMRAHVDQLHQQAISRAEAANALLDKQRNEIHRLTALNHSLNALNIRLTNAVLTFVEAQQDGELFPEPHRMKS